jgi:hypothetical protein
MNPAHLTINLPDYIHVLQLREIVAAEVRRLWHARHSAFFRAELRRLIGTLRILRSKWNFPPPRAPTNTKPRKRKSMKKTTMKKTIQTPPQAQNDGHEYLARQADLKARVRENMLASMVLHQLVYEALNNKFDGFYDAASSMLESACELGKGHPDLQPEIASIRKIAEGFDELSNCMYYASGEGDLGWRSQW